MARASLPARTRGRGHPGAHRGGKLSAAAARFPRAGAHIVDPRRAGPGRRALLPAIRGAARGGGCQAAPSSGSMRGCGPWSRGALPVSLDHPKRGIPAGVRGNLGGRRLALIFVQARSRGRRRGARRCRLEALPDRAVGRDGAKLPGEQERHWRCAARGPHPAAGPSVRSCCPSEVDARNALRGAEGAGPAALGRAHNAAPRRSEPGSTARGAGRPEALDRSRFRRPTTTSRDTLLPLMSDRRVCRRGRHATIQLRAGMDYRGGKVILKS